MLRIKPTGVKVEMLKKVGKAISNIPETFKPHPVVARDLKRKQQMFETGKDVDWSTAEALAFGTLLLEGNHVRLSGQVIIHFFILKKIEGEFEKRLFFKYRMLKEELLVIDMQFLVIKLLMKSMFLCKTLILIKLNLLLLILFYLNLEF